MNLKVQKGGMQDATFITADPGHAKSDTPRGNEAKVTRMKCATGGSPAKDRQSRGSTLSPKCVCKAGHVAVTTIPKVRVKMIINGIVFNVYHLASAKSR